MSSETLRASSSSGPKSENETEKEETSDLGFHGAMSSETRGVSCSSGAESENENEAEKEETSGSGLRGAKSSESWRASSGSAAEPENEAEEEETMSKSRRRLVTEDRKAALRKRRKKRKEEDAVDMSSAIGVWASSLNGPHLDLMVSLKQLAEVRLKNTGEKSLAACLTPASLRTIGIILEELIKDRMSMEYPPTNTDLRQGHGNTQAQQGLEISFSQARREEQGTGT